MRQEPHRRGEGQKRRSKSKVGEVPAEVVDRHAYQRQAPRAIDGVDAARALARAFLDSAALRSRRRGFKQRVVENEFAFEFDRAGHQHVIVRNAPFDHEFAAGQAHGSLALHQPQTRRRDQGRAGGRAAGERQSDPALPDARQSPRRAH